MVPSDVVAALSEVDDTTAIRETSRFAAWAHLGYVVFVPMILWLAPAQAGVEHLACVGVLASYAAFVTWRCARGGRIPGPVEVVDRQRALIVWIIARMLSPF